ncbi:MAG: hypothetical protein ACI93R_002147 [Flavobacteriales bacterium]
MIEELTRLNQDSSEGDSSQKSPRRRQWQESFVSFALRVYGSEDFEELCLKLQNEYHANVNIILWCCWLEAEDISLSNMWLDEVLITIDTLTQLTVSRLQEVRKVIKDSSGFTKVQSKLINKHILNAELTAEKIFLQRLQDTTMRFLEAEAFDPELHSKLSLEYYLGFLSMTEAPILARELYGYSLNKP